MHAQTTISQNSDNEIIIMCKLQYYLITARFWGNAMLTLKSGRIRAYPLLIWWDSCALTHGQWKAKSLYLSFQGHVRRPTTAFSSLAILH